MELHKALLVLTTKDVDGAQDFDDKLQKILDKTLPLLSEDIRERLTGGNEHNDSQSVRHQYLHAIVYTVEAMQRANTENAKDFFSVNEFCTVKVAIELIVSVGILPCLLPGVGVDLNKLCPKASGLKQEELTDLQKYERLCFSTKHIMNFYDDIVLKPAVLNQLGPLLAALLQLSYVPLMKPVQSCSIPEENMSGKQVFVMTTGLYQKLRKEQEEFSVKLHALLDNGVQAMIIKELMVILGNKSAPKWLRRNTQRHLVTRIMQPNGVMSLIIALCDDTLDLGVHWKKLETSSKLIATSHGNDPDAYYKSICPQLLNLLSSKNICHASTVANCCINALYECNPDVCVKSIIDVMAAPLMVETSDEMYGEEELEECLENLTKCFVTVEAKFKHLPCAVISKLSVPLFCVYNRINRSACVLQSKVKQLLLRLLHEKSLQHGLFSAILGHDITGGCGSYIKVQFGPSGGVEVLGLEEAPPFAEYADNLFDLVWDFETPSVGLFLYLLKFLTSLKENACSGQQRNLLETEDDTVDRIEKHLTVTKLLSDLANKATVQKALIKDPESLFTFTRSLFNEYEKTKVDGDADCEALYVSLMSIKIILSDRKEPLDGKPFKNFMSFLKDRSTASKLPVQLVTLMNELIEVIEKSQLSGPKFVKETSVESERSNEFEQAIRDLADPLLPVRAHGLITLTKLIESKDSCAIARKSVILRLFQENLKHEDSFVYLAAINGLCVLATTYPEIIIETLVQEYIDMPQRISSGEITPETRMKLGEILVKTTRGLGEMATVHRNLLINGFLCGVRDSDPLLRASALSCLGELCKILGFRLGDMVTEVIYCISCIIKSDKVPECRRAAVLVSTLLLRGLGRDVLTSLGGELVGLFRGLKHLRDNDEDPVVQLHAQLSLEEFDDIAQRFLFDPPKLEKMIFLLPSS